MKKALSLLLTALLCLALLPASASAAGETFTLMVYLCGTDLESDGGLATADLKEMIASGVKPDGGVNVYVQTGGTKTWEMKGIKDEAGERWKLTGDGMDRLESLGSVDMGDGDAFAAFLKYGFEHFPADRYGLILWDHGAGATDGRMLRRDHGQQPGYGGDLRGAYRRVGGAQLPQIRLRRLRRLPDGGL
jgi:hypothetical protein